MTAFFVPTVPPEDQEDFYTAIVKGAEEELNGPVFPTRIYSLQYSDGGKVVMAKVGEVHPKTGLTIYAILRHKFLYTIRMSAQGVFTIGDPFMVGLHDELDLVEFD
jgi:hypothetical protein